MERKLRFGLDLGQLAVKKGTVHKNQGVLKYFEIIKVILIQVWKFLNKTQNARTLKLCKQSQKATDTGKLPLRGMRLSLFFSHYRGSLPYVNFISAKIAVCNAGNVFARVHEPADLWDITFCTC